MKFWINHLHLEELTILTLIVYFAYEVTCDPAGPRRFVSCPAATLSDKLISPQP